jgi:hypothetical protein
MATSTYEQVLQEAQQLSPEEQQRLRDELGQPRQRKQKVTAQEAISLLDELAERISAKWQGEGTAADAIKEQRRDL